MRYDLPFRQTAGFRPVLLALFALAVLPWFIGGGYWQHLMILAFIYAVVASSWDLSLGYGGLFNFSHIALFATGLYTYAVLAKVLGISPWWALLLGGFAASLLAALIALPILRLDGVYVILVTLAMSQLVYQVVVSQSDITGGMSGMVTLPALKIGDYSFIKDKKIAYYYVGLVLLFVSTVFLYSVSRSRLGRAAMALRDEKFNAISRGVSEARTRILILVASAFFTGIAGAFYGSYLRVASPDAFGIGFLTLMLSILIVGGVSTIWGPIIGAFVITVASESIADLGPWRNIIIALAIILIITFYPGGLWAALQELRDFFAVRRTQAHAYLRRHLGRRQRQRRVGTTEQMLSTPHGHIAIADSGGDGPVVLMVHGNSACKEAFQYQFQALASSYRLIAFDLPGHGVSSNADPEQSYKLSAYAEVAERVIQHLGVTELAVFGWSLGGYVALEIAARDQLSLTGLAICGTVPLNRIPDDFAAGYNAESDFILAGKRHFSPSESSAYGASATAPYSDKSAFMHKNLPRTDGRARQFMISKLGITDWPRQIRTLRNRPYPFAIINGADDPFLNHQTIANADYGPLWAGEPVNITDGRHAPFFNQPDVFNARFSAFLDACFTRDLARDQTRINKLSTKAR